VIECFPDVPSLAADEEAGLCQDGDQALAHHGMVINQEDPGGSRGLR
jgi:hypothetical protein